MTQNQDSSLWDKIWKDKDGKIVLWQTPNIPLWVWTISTLLKIFINYGLPSRFLEISAFGSLFTWAFLEIKSGVNYFRRLLGMGVLIYIVISRTIT